LNPDFAVEREVMRKEQPSAAKTSNFAFEKAAVVSAFRNHVSKWRGEPSAKKDFETGYSGVLAAPGFVVSSAERFALAHF
jgi:hypothetical protein